MSLSNLLKTLLVLVISLPVILVILILDNEPSVTNSSELSQTELEAVQTFVIDNDPRAILNGQNRNIVLTESVADSLLKYTLSQSHELSQIRARTLITEGHAELLLSIPVSAFILGDFVNVSLLLSDSEVPVHIEQVSLGSLNVPDSLISFLLNKVDSHLQKNSEYQTLLSLLDSIADVSLQPGQASFTLQFSEQQISRVSNAARDLIISPTQQARVVDYYRLIMETEALLQKEGKTSTSVNAFIKPMFQQAYDRVIEGQDPPQENRAIFIALSVYLTDLKLEQITSTELNQDMKSHSWGLSVRLNGRRDLAQHLVTSAAISSTSNSSLTQLISVYKEVIDSRTRSGFSFDDMTANAVGTALGDIATQTQSIAHRLQFAMKDIEAESDYMPTNMSGQTFSEAEFEATFGNRNSEAYITRLKAMESVIAERPLFKIFNKTIALSAEP